MDRCVLPDPALRLKLIILDPDWSNQTKASGNLESISTALELGGCVNSGAVGQPCRALYNEKVWRRREMGHVWHLGAVYCLTIFPMSGEPPFLSTWWEQRNTLRKSSRPHHWLHDFLAAGARASGARPDGISSSSLGWSLEPRLSGRGDTLEGTKAPLRND